MDRLGSLTRVSSDQRTANLKNRLRRSVVMIAEADC